MLFNENKLDDMGKILKHYMSLVPTVSAEGRLLLPNGSEEEFDDSRFHSILFGGDQLTAARIRGAQALRDTQDKKVDRFEGLIAIIEDWHSRMTLLKVKIISIIQFRSLHFISQAIWGELYKTASAAERGTMYQLRNLINRTNVPKDPQDNMNAAEDYFLLLLHTHVVAAAKTIMKLNPQSSVTELARLIIVNYLRLPQVDDSKRDHSLSSCDADGVYLYATELLTLGLLWHGFHDSSKEGDGERILRHWKFLLIIFKSTQHNNYAKEAVNLLLQANYLLSDRQRAQLLWSRCVNTRGQPGANIPADLYNEHLNKRLKSIIKGQGANVKPNSIVRAGKALGPVHNICTAFERQTTSRLHSSDHSFPEFGKDFNTIAQVLEEQNVFVPTSSRQHTSFTFKCGILEKFSYKELLKRVEKVLNNSCS